MSYKKQMMNYGHEPSREHTGVVKEINDTKKLVAYDRNYIIKTSPQKQVDANLGNSFS